MQLILTVAAWWMAISLVAVPLWIAFLAKGGGSRMTHPPQSIAPSGQVSSPRRRTA